MCVPISWQKASACWERAGFLVRDANERGAFRQISARIDDMIGFISARLQRLQGENRNPSDPGPSRRGYRNYPTSPGRADASTWLWLVWPSIPPFKLLSVLAPSNNFDGHHHLAQHFTPWLGGRDDVHTQAPLSVLLFSSRVMDTASLRLATRA